MSERRQYASLELTSSPRRAAPTRVQPLARPLDRAPDEDRPEKGTVFPLSPPNGIFFFILLRILYFRIFAIFFFSFDTAASYWVQGPTPCGLSQQGASVVEETKALLDKDDAELLGRLEDGRVVLAAAGSGHVLDAGSFHPEDVVDKWELVILGVRDLRWAAKRGGVRRRRGKERKRQERK